MPIAAEYFIGTVGGELVCHLAVTPRFEINYYRGTRLVTMPEWQGAGCGTKFLNWIGEYHKRGNGRRGHNLPLLFHTSHPQLIGYLERSKKWSLVSQNIGTGSKAKCKNSIENSKVKNKSKNNISSSGYGGHFRSISGYKYIGDGKAPKKGIPK